jgi:hypothetical protein
LVSLADTVPLSAHFERPLKFRDLRLLQVSGEFAKTSLRRGDSNNVPPHPDASSAYGFLEYDNGEKRRREPRFLRRLPSEDIQPGSEWVKGVKGTVTP